MDIQVDFNLLNYQSIHVLHTVARLLQRLWCVSCIVYASLTTSASLLPLVHLALESHSTETVNILHTTAALLALALSLLRLALPSSLGHQQRFEKHCDE
jgi:hypothetical protein